MNYSNKIREASWLNESQKQRVLAVYDTIKWKDVIEQSFDMLDLFQPNARNANATSYKNMVVDIMANLYRLKLDDSIAEDYGELLKNLYLFFDNLDNPSFDKLVDIEQAYNYNDENGSYEAAIDKLYYETMKKTKDKLRLLETL